jgi:tyrosinase
MRYLFPVLGLVAIARGQYDYGVDRSTFIKRQDASLILTGAHSPDGSTGLRREMRDLETDSTTWTLYLLGLDMMQNTDQSQEASWYQIAGT